jgi:acyl carrier protein
MNNLPTNEALEMLAEVAGVPEIDPATKFGALSLDSLELIEWVSMLEEKVDTEFNIRELNLVALQDLSMSSVLDQLAALAVNA